MSSNLNSTTPSIFSANAPAQSAQASGTIMQTSAHSSWVSYQPAALSNSSITTNATNQYVIGGNSAANCISFYGYHNNANIELIKLDRDGVVTWAPGVTVDEGAEMFARALSLGAEMQAGITKKVKTDMRDSIFADIIDIAKVKGPLSADDLTFILEASKIVEKLKSNKE